MTILWVRSLAFFSLFLLHGILSEMSLNIDTVSGAIDLNYPERLRVPKRRTIKTQDLVMIDRTYALRF